MWEVVSGEAISIRDPCSIEYRNTFLSDKQLVENHISLLENTRKETQSRVGRPQNSDILKSHHAIDVTLHHTILKHWY